MRELFILNEGKVMEGFVNVRTGDRIVTCIRKATDGDYRRAEVRKIGRTLGKNQIAKPDDPASLV